MAPSTTTSLPSSPPNSDNTPTHPNPHTHQQHLQGGVTHDDATHVLERKPDLVDSFQDSDTAQFIEKYSKYESNYARWLKAKYFSKKNLYGGNIFEKEVIIDKETIKSSRWPCTRSYADPLQSFEDQSRLSASTAETSTNLANKKYPLKKGGS